MVSLLAISTTLVITLAILHWNYAENAHRKLSKKQTILNHWGKHKPTQEDLDKLYLGEVEEVEKKRLVNYLLKTNIKMMRYLQEKYPTNLK